LQQLFQTIALQAGRNLSGDALCAEAHHRAVTIAEQAASGEHYGESLCPSAAKGTNAKFTGGAREGDNRVHAQDHNHALIDCNTYFK